jgi:hypothetical protein
MLQKSFLLFYCTLSLLYAQKASIKANGEVIYFKKQLQSDSLSEMLKKGNFYGRIRNNNFLFHYNTQNSSHSNNLIGGLGGSLIYKSAIFKGFDTTIGFYASHAFFDESKLDSISYLRPGKDTLSRFEYVNSGSKSLYALAQANISYRYSKTKITFGRELIESFYTHSSNSKMIPNSFDGMVIDSKDISNTHLKIAYLAKQKLRDHQKSHAILMVGDENSAPGLLQPQWSENDDSAMHKGLTYTALKSASKPTDAPLLLVDVTNKSIKNTQLHFAAYSVPSLISQCMGEFNYNFHFQNITISPGLRFIQQFDNGAGGVGGASLLGDVSALNPGGYKNPTSLNSKMVAARIVSKIVDYKVNFAWTKVLDEADLVTPWRGFPTAGYTRSMGIYNWRANMASYRIEIVKGAKKDAIYTSPFIQASLLYIDGDTTKKETKSLYYYAGIIQNIPTLPQLQYRVRFGFRNFIKESSSLSDYIDSRLEFNYLF